ncbi:pyrroline-5-carboxylate reductase [Bdellovibrionota bacterium FG-2]
MKLGILGLGKMGEAVVEGLRRSEDSAHFKIEGSTRSLESAQEAEKSLHIPCYTDNRKLAGSVDVLVLSVKPHQAEAVLRQIAKKLTAKQTLISICASITTEQLSKWSGGKAAVIRAMPNTPCLIGEGMTVFCPGPGATKAHTEIAERIFSKVGKTAVVEESLMDGVTGLSGCGPAYIYLVIEALSEAGVKVGLPRKTATLLAAQTLLGAAKMVLERGEHPAYLKDEVTTPAGCTIDGLMALEEGKLRVTLIKAVLAAAKRSKSLRGA